MRFDFAISFAGPERETARRLSQALKEAGLSVFFDELFEHEMLGRDGVDYLNDIFFSQSEYCIALVSRAYEQKAWAQLERRAAQARELHSQAPGFLIPVLCDDVRPSWLLPTRIFFDLQQRPLEVLVQILLKRAFSFPGGSYKPSAKFEDLFGKDTSSLSNVFGTRDFVVWSTYEPSQPQRPFRISKQRDSGLWHKIQLPVAARGRHMFLVADLLVIVPEHSTDPVKLISLSTEQIIRIFVPRQRRWNSLTDCKFNGRALLLSYCGADVWTVDLQTHETMEIVAGSDDVAYGASDWLDEGLRHKSGF